MKSWLNSLILDYFGFSSKFISVRENVLLVQSNHHSFFAVSSLQALAAALWRPGGAAATANVGAVQCAQQSSRQWPKVSDFVALRVQFSHVRVFSDSLNVQKRVKRIIYLGPLPTEQGGRGGPCKHRMDVTDVEISWACLSARNLQVDRLSKSSTSRTYPEGAIRSSKGFQAGEGR